MDINDRPIRTAIEKLNGAVLRDDQRGKHDNHAKMNPEVLKGIKEHIDSIPRIESHYLRAHSTRQYICGSKTIADIHRDYVLGCERQNIEPTNYTAFYRVFNDCYNISFFVAKTDKRTDCLIFSNSSEAEKAQLKEQHDDHFKEKELAWKEKDTDRDSSDAVVAVYD